MSNNYETSSVKCPFYRMPKGSKNIIRCEGTTDSQTTELVFSHTAKKKEWQDKYCNSFSFLACPYAKMIDDVWKEKLSEAQEK